MTRIEALAEANASMDGKLRLYADPEDLGGYRMGYQTEAEEIIRRLESRGYTVVAKP